MIMILLTIITMVIIIIAIVIIILISVVISLINQQRTRKLIYKTKLPDKKQNIMTS